MFAPQVMKFLSLTIKGAMKVVCPDYMGFELFFKIPYDKHPVSKTARYNKKLSSRYQSERTRCNG